MVITYFVREQRAPGMARLDETKYFHRVAAWDWLNKEMIHVTDPHGPRMITMDPWPQKIFLDATGERTIAGYITDMAASYPRGHVPAGLREMIIEELDKLANDLRLVAFADRPVELDMAVKEARTREGVARIEGRWEGQYEYDHGQRPPVPFTIVIHEVRGDRFRGTVTDDEAHGGTPGTGTVEGTWNADGVTFIKQMPIRTTQNERGERVVDARRKHRPIHYEGRFSRSKETLTGTWRFKDRIRWKGLLPYRETYQPGTWTMKRCESE